MNLLPALLGYCVVIAAPGLTSRQAASSAGHIVSFTKRCISKVTKLFIPGDVILVSGTYARRKLPTLSDMA